MGSSISYPTGTYTFYGFTQTPDGAYWRTGSSTVTIKSTSNITSWSWTSSNGSASDKQTQIAYEILQGLRPTSDGFSHLVWNDLVNKVAEIRSAKGLGWDENIGGIPYLAKGQCYVSSGQTLSADIYNSVRFQVGSIKGTQITDRTTGDEILGYYITRITDVLNEIIQEI